MLLNRSSMRAAARDGIPPAMSRPRTRSGGPVSNMTSRAPIFLCVCLLAGAAAAPAAEPNVPPSPDWQHTWERFLEASGPGWTFEWNGVTGTPHRISGHAIELPEAVTRDNAEALAKRVVGRYAALLLADPDD